VLSKNCLCIVIDRLHAGMIGAYGNSWIRTQHIDRLAASSFLFDQAFVQNPSLEQLYRSLWLGQHRGALEFGSAISVLRSAGWHTALVTDEPAVAGLPWAADFDEVIRVELPSEDHTVDEPSQTQIALVLDTVAGWLRSAPQPFFLWVHARGMSGAWDAPLELRNQYADEDDPPPPTISSPPNLWLPEGFDPDEVLGYTHAYAGQVSVLDSSIHSLIEQLQSADHESTTQVTLLSARGCPLGEHHRVGPTDEALYNELLQLVWLMHFPDRTGQLDRSQALVTPADLPGTLLDWLELDRGGRTSLMPIIRGTRDAIRDHLCMASTADRAIRTPAWLLRQPNDRPAELYAKPGDRWEVNEVARLCPDVTARLQVALNATDEPGETGKETTLAPDLVTQLD
jgi:arylsulfatase A-like enzyme